MFRRSNVMKLLNRCLKCQKCEDKEHKVAYCNVCPALINRKRASD